MPHNIKFLKSIFEILKIVFKNKKYKKQFENSENKFKNIKIIF